MLARVLALWLALCPALAFAQSAVLNGFPPGTFQSRAPYAPAASASYLGPVDAFAGASGYWSCSRVADAALASTSTSMCDLVALTGGATVCTLRGTASGFVDLAANYCAGTTPAAACAAASGGSCRISKVYNQVNPGTLDMVQGTLASMPTIAFNTLNGLPVITLVPSQFLASFSTVTQAAPYSMSAVFLRASGGGAGAYLSSNNTVTGLRGAGTANNLGFSCGTAVAVAATDAAWHAANSTCSSTAAQDAIRIDAIDTTGQTAGTTGPSSSTLRIGESNAGVFISGSVAEAIFYPTGMASGDRSNVNANQHSATNGYNF